MQFEHKFDAPAFCRENPNNKNVINFVLVQELQEKRKQLKITTHEKIRPELTLTRTWLEVDSYHMLDSCHE